VLEIVRRETVASYLIMLVRLSSKVDAMVYIAGGEFQLRKGLRNVVDSVYHLSVGRWVHFVRVWVSIGFAWQRKARGNKAK
jgi:hypothetical protein